jgi:hypothetical protein
MQHVYVIECELTGRGAAAAVPDPPTDVTSTAVTANA